MSQQKLQPLEYRSRTRSRQGQFAPRFVVFASIGLVLAGLSAMLHGLAILGVVSAGTSAAYAIGVEVVLHLLLDAFVIVGCAGTLFRSQWARTVMPLPLAFLVGLNGFELARAVFGSGRAVFHMPWFVLLITFGSAISWMVFGYVGFKLYRSLYADFYFGRADGGPPGSSVESTPIAKIKPASQPYTFVLRGIDVQTHEAKVIESRTKTEALAFQSAVALGLDPSTITVTPIAQGVRDNAT